MAEELSVEGSGETVGEAKWAALRELERLRPGIDKAAVKFEVVTEGKRGLLGVGYAPALVTASLADLPPEQPAPAHDPESDLAAEVKTIVERIASSLGARCRVEVRQKEDHLDVQCSGGDLGVLIGRHGQTIDAVQYLVNAIARRTLGDEVKLVVVDAARYRERRQATLETIAARAAERARRGDRVELEPMSAPERKIVHLHLQDEPGVTTESSGVEPYRYVVVSPAGD